MGLVQKSCLLNSGKDCKLLFVIQEITAFKADFYKTEKECTHLKFPVSVTFQAKNRLKVTYCFSCDQPVKEFECRTLYSVFSP